LDLYIAVIRIRLNQLLKNIILAAIFYFISIGQTATGQTSIDSLLDLAYQIYSENPTKSFEYAQLAKTKALEQGDHSYDAEIGYCVARYYVLTTKYDLASAQLTETIALCEENNDLFNLASIYSLKAIMLGKIGDFNGAHSLQLKSISLEKESGDLYAYHMAIANFSLDYMELGDLDSMKIWLEVLDSIAPLINGDEAYYRAQNWGIYHKEKGNIRKANEQLNIALELAEKQQLTDSKATVYALLAGNYRAIGNYSSAEASAMAGYQLAQENHLIFEASENLIELIEVLKEQNKFKEALTWQTALIKIEKEIYDLEKIQKVKRIEGQLKLAEKEKIIAQGEADLKASELIGQQAKTRNTWMYGIVIIVCLLLFFIIFIFVKTKKLNSTIRHQKKEVEIKSENLEEALTNIHDSLEYSKLIQKAMLPSPEVLQRSFKDHFVLYEPKDIVSGDFYWLHQTETVTIIAVGDCTGHGVPGAMVSMVCHEALNKTVKELGIYKPGEILDEVRKMVIKTFEKSKDNLHDGMDICLCAINNNSLSYAGAHNPLWILRGNDIIVTKGDKQPIGNFDLQQPFTTHDLELEDRDKIYLFSDGYADQFGGEKGKKMKSANMKKLLLTIKNEPMMEQRSSLKSAFDRWKGDLEQIDDVCIIGIKIND